MDNLFSDQMHIDRIRHALWQGSQFGRASVFIGSGFSRNAVAISASTKGFPLWGELSQALVDALFPKHASNSKDRDWALQQAKSTSGALRLAEEFEAAFGRNALDNFLLQEIPDNNFDPGPLHKLLLSLPWSDVLTVNYDTLLERACVGLVNRKYDVVRTMQDIPRASKPRIVKLHGSFPSNDPYIFTEENFRTYPRLFGPFVNLAQQSIMENVFCLLGFSGDDPNFLYWTGWVRDNLKNAAPQIYLCGLLSLTPARRKLLQDRNVVPIDLSPLFPVSKFPNQSVRHANATEWFLMNLKAGEPPNLLSWPSSSVVSQPLTVHGMPIPPYETHAIAVAEQIQPDF